MVVLQGARIVSQTARGEFVGSIVVSDGKITAVGESIEVPENADVIDLAGYTLVPGLIDSRSTMRLTSLASANRAAGEP